MKNPRHPQQVVEYAKLCFAHNALSSEAFRLPLRKPFVFNGIRLGSGSQGTFCRGLVDKMIDGRADHVGSQ